MTGSTLLASNLLLLALVGCRKQPPADAPSTSSIASGPVALADHAWTLTSLGERTNPMGAGDRPLDLTFASAESRASGFAGCNRFSGAYTVAGDSLHFGPLLSTKMACQGVDDVEQVYLDALQSVTGYSQIDSTLRLRRDGAVVAEFRAR